MRPNPAIIRYSLTALFADTSFAIVQKATPNKMPPIGLLSVKINVIRMLYKIGFPERNSTFAFRMKATNWNKKYNRGRLTRAQYFTFPSFTE